MENINLDDYHVSIEYLDDFEDNNIDDWINNSEKPEKINKLLNKVRKTSGSFETKRYQVTSTDPVLCPFFYNNGNTNVINYAETRHIYFYPNINDVFDEQCNANTSINDMDKSLNTSNNNHVISSLKKEKIIKEIVPEKVVKESSDSTPLAPNKVVNGHKKSKRKLNQTEETNGSVDPMVSVKDELKSPKIKKRKLHENNVDLDTSFVKGEPVAVKEEKVVDFQMEPEVADVQIEKEVVDVPKENEVVDVTEVKTTEKKKKKKKKSKEASENMKVESNTAEVVSMKKETEQAINGDISLKKEKKHKKKHRKHEEKNSKPAE